MKVLISEKLSEHKYKTPEGYLICTDAILARTGKQSYTKDELFQDGDNTEVNVDRPYDEVMNAKTIASFENKPITFDHPDEDVNVGNYKDYAIGYVRDVHQGKTDKGEDVILGNLVITDQDAINAIEQGDHTDLSCGYDCDIRDDGNGNYSQTNIRGNHLALCEQGRAGIARIVDSKINDKLSYEAASSDDNYLDEVEKMIYKFANVRVDAMLVGDKLKIAARNSKGFNSKQLNDIASVLMKNVAVSNITISNPDRFDSNVTAKIVDSKVEDSLSVKEKKLCNYMLENALDDGEDENDLLKKMKVYYSEYSNLARSKPNEVLQYFKSHINDSKVEDAAIGGHYKNNRGENFFICSYGSGFSIFKADGEYLDGSKHLSLDGVKQRILYYNLTKVKDSVVDSKVKDKDLIEGKTYTSKSGNKLTINKVYAGYSDISGKPWVKIDYSFVTTDGRKGRSDCFAEDFYRMMIDSITDSKVEDVNYSEKEIKEAAMKLLKQKPFLTYEEALQKVKENIRNGNYLLDNKIEDSKLNYDTLKEIKSDIYYAMKNYWQTVFSDEWFDEKAFSLEQDYHDEKILILRFKIRKEAYFRTESDFEKFKARLTTIPDLKLKKIHKKSVKVPYYDNDKFIQVDEITFQYIGQMTDSMRDDYSIKEIEDAGWKTTKMASGIIHELGNKRIIEEENEKGDIQYRIGGTNGQVFSSLEAAKNAIRRKHLDAKDSKEMTMSDAIKMLNIVNVYKKVRDSYIVVRNKSKYEDAARKLGLTIEKDSKKLRIYGDRYKLKQLQNQFDNDEEISYVVIKDASKNEWVIKNTGLAYEIWNQGKMVKKFPTKKLAIEWIHSRFPTDEITEDSTKDGRLWQTLTRKAKH